LRAPIVGWEKTRFRNHDRATGDVKKQIGGTMPWVDILGYAASAAVLATFCMSAMIPLRVLALGGSVQSAACLRRMSRS